MKTTRHPGGRRALNLGEHEYDVVQNFVCLGSSVNAECSETGEIKRRITAGNTSYFALSSLFKSRSLSWSSKLRMYKSLIRPVVSYGSETWVLNQKSTDMLDIFKWKVLRRIFGPVNEGGHWRMRRNEELRALYQEASLSTAPPVVWAPLKDGRGTTGTESIWGTAFWYQAKGKA